MLVLVKSPGLYRTRIFNSLGLLFIGAGFAALYHYVGLRAATQLVPTVTFILLLVCLFAGVHLTADSISKEKREGTIGLLFLTNLTPFQIVIGKLIAHGLMGFYTILIVVPLLSLIMIVGGTRFSEVLSIGLVALNIMFFSASVGLWASAQHTERKKAAGTGTWMVVLFWWGIPIILQLMRYFKFPEWSLQALSVFAVNGIFNSTFAGPRLTFLQSPWLSVAVNHLTAWAFIGWATYLLRTGWQDQPARSKYSLREQWRKLSLGNEAARLRLRQKLMDKNPFLWLASRDRLRSFSVWVFTIIFSGFIVFMVAYGGAALNVGMFMMVISLCSAHKFMASGLAAQQLAVEQEQGTLEMLLSTPLKAETILNGQLRATLRQFQGPALLGLIMQLLAVVMIWYSDMFEELTVPITVGIAVYAAIYLLDIYAIAWMGMFGAVTVKDPKNAAGVAILRIIVLPGLIFGTVMALGSLGVWYWDLGFEPEPVMLLGFWFLLGIATDLGWLVYTRKRLPTLLREFAMRRYSPNEKLTFFGKLGTLLGRMHGRSKAPAAQQPPMLTSR
jgi:ABC-type Na+ efflux pump permease subunit